MTIYCIGRNYLDHVKELNNALPEGEPVVFLKSEASLRGLDPAPIAFPSEEFHHEAELVLKIGTSIPMGSLDLGWQQISEIALGIDVTRRKVQNELKAKGLPWTTAKSFSGSAVVTPFVALDAFKDPSGISFSFAIRDELKQQGNVAQMIFSVPHIIRFLASFSDLYPGDLIFTGTPKGVGPLYRGDRFRLSFDHEGLSWEGVF